MHFESPLQPEAEKLSVKEQLCSLKGAEIKDLEVNPEREILKGKDVFMIEVTDKDVFQTQAEIEKMVGPFGKVVFNEFEPKENPRSYDAGNPEMAKNAAELIEFNICHSDRIIVVSEGDKIIGFFAIEFLPMENGSRAAYVALTMVDGQEQKKGYNKEMYNLAFEQRDVSAFVGISFVPQAVSNRLKIGNENGYDGFFCGFKNGVRGDLGSPEEQAKVEELSRMMVDKSIEEKVLINGDIPKGYVVWQKALAMDPIRKEDVNFSPGNPLTETYEKELLPTQEKYAPDTVYGILINLKRNN